MEWKASYAYEYRIKEGDVWDAQNVSCLSEKFMVKLFYLLTTVKIYLQGISKLISNPVVNGKAYQLLQSIKLFLYLYIYTPYCVVNTL